MAFNIYFFIFNIYKKIKLSYLLNNGYFKALNTLKIKHHIYNL